MIHAIFMSPRDDLDGERRAARPEMRLDELTPLRFAIGATVDQVAEREEEAGAGRSDLLEDRSGIRPCPVIPGSRKGKGRGLGLSEEPAPGRYSSQRQEHEECPSVP